MEFQMCQGVNDFTLHPGRHHFGHVYESDGVTPVIGNEHLTLEANTN